MKNGETRSPPTPLAREEVRDSLDGMFFPEGSKERDYFEFVSETNADAIEAYCRIVKESSPLFGHELCAGVFYGYMYLPQAANAGHLALRRIIDSEYGRLSPRARRDISAVSRATRAESRDRANLSRERRRGSTR